MEPQGLPAQLSTWVLNHVLWIDEDYYVYDGVAPPGLVLALLCGTARAFFNVEVGPSGASGRQPNTDKTTSAQPAADARPRSTGSCRSSPCLSCTRPPRVRKWTGEGDWNRGDPCNWYGVRCDRDGDDADGTLVTHLQLPANKLNGTIPDIFADLPHLRVLDLSLNYLRGAVPASIGRLQHLAKSLTLGTTIYCSALNLWLASATSNF